MVQSETPRRAALVTGGRAGWPRRLSGTGCRGAWILPSTAGSAAAAEQTAADCRALGVQAVALQADVRRPDACKQLVEDGRRLGRLDVLVNNAGVTADKLLLQMTEADFDAVIETNLKGAFFCTKRRRPPDDAPAVRPHYQRQQRSGPARQRGSGKLRRQQAQGLIGLMKSVAKEYASPRRDGQHRCAGLYHDRYDGSHAGGCPHRRKAPPSRWASPAAPEDVSCRHCLSGRRTRRVHHRTAALHRRRHGNVRLAMNSNNKRRVVITGLGTVNPTGSTVGKLGRRQRLAAAPGADHGLRHGGFQGRWLPRSRTLIRTLVLTAAKPARWLASPSLPWPPLSKLFRTAALSWKTSTAHGSA